MRALGGAPIKTIQKSAASARGCARFVRRFSGLWAVFGREISWDFWTFGFFLTRPKVQKSAAGPDAAVRHWLRFNCQRATPRAVGGDQRSVAECAATFCRGLGKFSGRARLPPSRRKSLLASQRYP